MIYTNLLFETNKCFGIPRVQFRDKTISYKNKSDIFSIETIRSILRFANGIIYKGYPSRMPVCFYFKKDVRFSDKLAYILFESVCYHLIQCGHPIYIDLKPDCDIITHGYQSSPLLLLTTKKVGRGEKYNSKFHQETYGLHFRRVLQNHAQEEELSMMMDDIAIFQKLYDIKSEDREKITEVLVELVGNAKEHTSGDCLIDFDISSTYLKRDANNGKRYRGINIAILNFSPELLGTSIRKKLFDCDELPERYNLVRKAYEYHKPYFGEIYQEEDFYNITTFQHKISGRDQKVTTGGTGLTKLIQSLEESSDAYNCYVISGWRKIEFQKEYMLYNEDYWIGFNDENDFLMAPPSPNLLQRSPIYFPGTAYNLNFVMEVM